MPLVKFEILDRREVKLDCVAGAERVTPDCAVFADGQQRRRIGIQPERLASVAGQHEAVRRQTSGYWGNVMRG